MQIEYDKSLRALNTFSVNAQAKVFITISDESEIPKLFNDPTLQSPLLFLGGGSNILFTGNFPGTVIQLRAKGIQVEEDSTDDVLLKVAAGEEWEDFVDYCIRNSYYGVENLAGIPGWVGSAPVQNIGAYGVEVKDVIEKVEGYDIEKQQFQTYTNEESAFSYRSSLFKVELKNRFFITNVYFRLSKKESWTLHYSGLREELSLRREVLSLKSIVESVLSLRNKKLPDVKKIGSAGSFFKNPLVAKTCFESLREKDPGIVYYPVSDEEVKLAAGYLIEQCGWKGIRRGEVGVYPHQALVIVNYGNATGEEIVTLYQDIQHSVYKKYGVLLEPEVNILQ